MTAILNLIDEKIVEGNDVPITFNLIDPDDGSYYDWTGVTEVWFAVKETEEDLDAAAKIFLKLSVNPTQVKIDHPTADVGQMWVEMSKTNTAGLASYGPLKYEIKVTKSTKDNTLIQGDIVFRHGRIEETS